MTARRIGPAAGRLARRWAGPVLTVGFLGGLCWSLVRQWPQVGAALGDLSPAALALAAGAVLAGLWCSFECWRAVLADLGGRVSRRAGMRIFFIAQAGKYLPGAVWPVVAQVRLGREHRVPGRVCAAAATLFLLVLVGTGVLVAAAGWLLPGADAGRYWWLLAVLPPVTVLLWPPVLNRGLRWVLRVARQPPLPRPVTTGGIGRAAGWALAMWGLYGCHLWALLGGPGTAPGLAPRAAAGFAAAWTAGFLLLVAPAGAGPREMALVVLLSGAVGQPAALAAAMVSRLLLTLGDLAWPVLALLLPSPAPPAGSGPAAGQPPADRPAADRSVRGTRTSRPVHPREG